jgi:hypothetical protein
MVNKRQKTEGAASKATTAAPKSRVATKAKPIARTAAAAPAPTSVKAAKPAKAKAAKLPTLSTDDIALRAYFIAEKRQQLGLPGDSLSDWVQAEAELISELRTIGLN